MGKYSILSQVDVKSGYGLLCSPFPVFMAEIQCGPYSKVGFLNTQLKVNGTTYGTTGQVKCTHGFKRFSTDGLKHKRPTVTCGSDGKWKTTPANATFACVRKLNSHLWYVHVCVRACVRACVRVSRNETVALFWALSPSSFFFASFDSCSRYGVDQEATVVAFTDGLASRRIIELHIQHE